VTTLRSRYLSALDIPEYLHLGKNTEELASQLVKVQCLVVETECAESMCQSGVAQDFLYKMLLAIGLDKQNIVCIQSPANQVSQALSKYKAQVVLVMDTQVPLTHDKMFVIHHPGDILKNEQLKREAWEVLKKVKACLQ
jgi:hypothetical protein